LVPNSLFSHLNSFRIGKFVPFPKSNYYSSFWFEYQVFLQKVSKCAPQFASSVTGVGGGGGGGGGGKLAHFQALFSKTQSNFVFGHLGD
jgi:hypothetical protein